MYEKLVESLRNCVADENGCCFRCPEDCNGPCQENLMTEAADAIEELQELNCELLFRVGQAEALIDYYQTGRTISNEPPKEG